MAAEHKYDYGGIVMKKESRLFKHLLKSRGFFCEKFRGNFLQFVNAPPK